MTDTRPETTPIRYPEDWLASLQGDPEFSEALEKEMEAHTVRAEFNESVPDPSRALASALAGFWVIEEAYREDRRATP
jgi:hypothetical protein